MFPTIGHLFEYVFNTRLSFPIQTLGFFVALSFLLAYVVFTSEFKRYEANGKIHAFKRTVVVGKPASVLDLLVNFLLGFILGFKFLGAIFYYQSFVADPRRYLLSIHGSTLAGLLAGTAFAVWVYLDKKRDQLQKPTMIEETRHPYQLMGLIVFSVGFFGFIGAKLFDAAEHIAQFRYNPLAVLFSSNGFAYYGGLIFGALTYLYIGYRHGMKQVHLADIGSPGMMLAYGIGRIGCQLAGDGDWGIINMHVKPQWLNWLPNWMWSFKYPHNAINAGIPIPGCNGNYCNQLVKGVYPTPFYEAALCIGMFLLMWAFRKKIKVPGLMFCIYLILNGGERFLIEHIRINFNYSYLGITFTQAELIGSLMLLGGVVGLAIIAYKRFRPYRQPV
ncbi:prolipoprotein diacylglyceryl transferase [Mucilaginibacter sp. AK015]|uniref:prolipoprotein diacylglyceryl transferase n=1 Tax=Mucilaginibacter sp. AK015 TaxID=2723072 RepID=UPI0016135A1D|nr:prolipoprotein diacylglyceryl transferase family protein [Mucilaginibacter sp. AK015]MBB5394099.1 phosphatidylglycerol:prolipoprotein diacylglycerol transferase [Mucilaginibacter sp. AK015]